MYKDPLGQFYCHGHAAVVHSSDMLDFSIPPQEMQNEGYLLLSIGGVTIFKPPQSEKTDALAFQFAKA